MQIRFFQADAFTQQPFKGNQAGVCLLEEMLPDETLLHIAAENNLSETAFLLRQRDEYLLRWFTPAVEVALCGHGTLAAAHVLWQTAAVPADEMIRFHTLSGLLTAKQQPGGWIGLDFPARVIEEVDAPGALKAIFPDAVQISYSVDRYIIELPDDAAVRNYQPDFNALKPYRTVITARGKAPYDFVSRYFAGPVGISEDPVTGTAHCSLATYWAAHLGKNEFFAYQASPRGGELQVELQGDRVLLRGQAVTVIDGYFHC
ncbi:PhzF family phenazine biosynthesis protein [Chitinophaga vietnamensis]|uniref:PhzF family phenazine biosynthesis protein n=1 Tax=Chitinophaga vietnamensis TaxID=2593957 RepID=UPI001177734D|nr:PhzF family phenazine biosynthesis isomerase [Chitinophaga vietnamensis]